MPTDANADNVYEVTVQASDGKKTGMRKVMVSVTNAEEAGVVTLDKITPVVGILVMAIPHRPGRRHLQAHLAMEYHWSPMPAVWTGVTSTGDGPIDGRHL